MNRSGIIVLGLLLSGCKTGINNDDIFVPFTIRVPVALGGVEPDNSTLVPVFSANGRFIAFHGRATNLVPGDTNGSFDVFVYDMLTRAIERVSVDSNEAEGIGRSENASISGDGRFVAFESEAVLDFLLPDSNGVDDIYVRDRFLGETIRVSLEDDEGQIAGASILPSISDDGQKIAFVSTGMAFDITGVVGMTDAGGTRDVFLRDSSAETTVLVSITTPGGDAAATDSSNPSISADGLRIVFDSTSAILAGPDLNGAADIFLREGGATTCLSIIEFPGIGPGNGSSTNPRISPDGVHVAFLSSATNLVATGVDTNGWQDAFVRNIQAGTTIIASRREDGGPVNEPTTAVSISPDGRHVVFITLAANVVKGDSNHLPDAFYRDLQTGAVERVSVRTFGGQADDVIEFAAIAPDAKSVAFSTKATNLVDNDFNGTNDVFLHVRLP